MDKNERKFYYIMAKKPSPIKKNVGKQSNQRSSRINSFKTRIQSDRPTQVIYGVSLVSLVLIAVSGWLWWTKIFTDADHVFDGMLANSLTSSSVSRRITQKDQSSSVDQTVYLSFAAPEVLTETRTVLSQKGNTRQTTTVTTETIGTKNDDFVRYVSAEGTDQLSVSANVQNVLGVWAKRSSDPKTGVQAGFLNEALFSIVPFGNLTPDQRRELTKLMDDENLYEFSSAKRSFENGRYVYNYSLSVKPEAFITMLAKYVQVTGIGDNSQLNPENFKDSAPISLNMKVDILSRQLLSTEYTSQARTDSIESRNVYRDVQFPSDGISFSELENKLLYGKNEAPKQNDSGNAQTF